MNIVIYFKDKVLINMATVAKTDGSRGREKRGWPIVFYNQDVKIMNKWIFETEIDRDEALISLKIKVKAISL